jgi:hypothetical protein
LVSDWLFIYFTVHLYSTLMQYVIRYELRGGFRDGSLNSVRYPFSPPRLNRKELNR